MLEVKDIFVTVVVVVQNQCSEIESTLRYISNCMTGKVVDYEIVVVDNASFDQTYSVLQTLTGIEGIPNVQVYTLTKEVDNETAVWIGLERGLGDYFLVFDPNVDDLSNLSEILAVAVSDTDVVFIHNTNEIKQSMGYRFGNYIFNILYKKSKGIDLLKEAPSYRLLSKRVVNFMSQYSEPTRIYRYLPATSGFAKEYMVYSSLKDPIGKKRLRESLGKGWRLLLSTTTPMRVVNVVCLFGAFANIIYSAYVLIIGVFLENVAKGWVSTSLQISGMFFLISLVLFIFGEYILRITQKTNGDPEYHIGQELTSAKLTRRDRLNIEVCDDKG